MWSLSHGIHICWGQQILVDSSSWYVNPCFQIWIISIHTFGQQNNALISWHFIVCLVLVGLCSLIYYYLLFILGFSWAPGNSLVDWQVHCFLWYGIFTVFCFVWQSDHMTNKWHIYMTKDGRISLAGLSLAKCEYLADAIIDSYHNVS